MTLKRDHLPIRVAAASALVAAALWLGTSSFEIGELRWMEHSQELRAAALMSALALGSALFAAAWVMTFDFKALLRQTDDLVLRGCLVAVLFPTAVIGSFATVMALATAKHSAVYAAPVIAWAAFSMWNLVRALERPVDHVRRRIDGEGPANPFDRRFGQFLAITLFLMLPMLAFLAVGTMDMVGIASETLSRTMLMSLACMEVEIFFRLLILPKRTLEAKETVSYRTEEP